MPFVTVPIYQFLHEIQHGLNCSPFEAQAVLDVAKEVYLPFLDPDVVKAPPGKMTLVAVGADEPSGKPINDCQKQTVCLTLRRGAEDDRLLQQHDPRHRPGPDASRPHRPAGLGGQDHHADLPDYKPLAGGGDQLPVHLRTVCAVGASRDAGRAGRIPFGIANGSPTVIWWRSCWT